MRFWYVLLTRVIYNISEYEVDITAHFFWYKPPHNNVVICLPKFGLRSGYYRMCKSVREIKIDLKSPSLNVRTSTTHFKHNILVKNYIINRQKITLFPAK